MALGKLTNLDSSNPDLYKFDRSHGTFKDLNGNPGNLGLIHLHFPKSSFKDLNTRKRLFNTFARTVSALKERKAEVYKSVYTM